MKKSGVYILKSLKTGRYYIGSADDVDKRLEQHNNGLVHATRFIAPLELKAFI